MNANRLRRLVGGSVRSGWVMASVVVIVVAVVFAGFIGTVRQIDWHYSHRACGTWAQVHDRSTKWVEYNFWSYECLVKTPQGRWVSTKKWGSYGN